MEILKQCSTVTCPMRATACKYQLDFNPKYDRIRTKWERERTLALAKPRGERERAVRKVDEKFLPILEPILMEDIKKGIVKCKADFDVPINDNLSLDQIAETFGITRPRVQQIEVRAKEKIAKERKEFQDFIGVVQAEGA